MFGVDDLVLGGLNFLGNQISTNNTNDANARNVAATNATNIQLAQQNTDFQERMSNTSYQRSMADMSKAGLNPMLAYMKGGASTPSGSTATTQSARVEGPPPNAVNSAMDAMNRKKERELLDNQVDLVDAQKFKTLAEGREAHTSADIAAANKKAALLQAENNKRSAEYDSAAVGFDAISKRAERAAGLVGTSAKAAGSLTGALLREATSKNPSSANPDKPGKDWLMKYERNRNR